jgi:hypothetical protein
MDSGKAAPGNAGELLTKGLEALLRHDLEAADQALVRLEREGDPVDYAQMVRAFLREMAR